MALSEKQVSKILSEAWEVSPEDLDITYVRESCFRLCISKVLHGKDGEDSFLEAHAEFRKSQVKYGEKIVVIEDENRCRVSLEEAADLLDLLNER